MFGSLVPARPALVERERFVFGSLDGHQGLADGMLNAPPTPAPKTDFDSVSRRPGSRGCDHTCSVARLREIEHNKQAIKQLLSRSGCIRAKQPNKHSFHGHILASVDLALQIQYRLAEKQTKHALNV